MASHCLDRLSFAQILRDALDREGLISDQEDDDDNEVRLRFSLSSSGTTRYRNLPTQTQVLKYSSWLAHQKIFDDFRFCNHRFVQVFMPA
jgi:hypothetical protein